MMEVLLHGRVVMKKAASGLLHMESMTDNVIEKRNELMEVFNDLASRLVTNYYKASISFFGK